MDVTGILKVKNETQQVSEKFKKREFVLTENSSQYPQHISFQLAQDKCSIIDGCNVGDEIKVHFNLQGREWTSPKNEVKYFNTLDVWKVETVGANSSKKAEPAQKTTPQASNAVVSSSTFAAAADDDLPF